MSDEFLHQRHVDENKSIRNAFLAGAPAAIAFAFHETAERTLAWSLLPVPLAILAWGASFASGIWASRQLQLAIKGNVGMNLAEREENEEFYNRAKATFEGARDRTWAFQEAQMWLLFVGAAFYLVGHVWYITESASSPADDSRVNVTSPARASPVKSAPNTSPARRTRNT
uniref:hypothetical protein n=1 Tax=Altererythrobacter segetis TaxID=1104773 RepID=UPI00140DE2A3|nr:hypothetical protein [Altererythrobacter segetis]